MSDTVANKDILSHSCCSNTVENVPCFLLVDCHISRIFILTQKMKTAGKKFIWIFLRLSPSPFSAFRRVQYSVGISKRAPKILRCFPEGLEKKLLAHLQQGPRSNWASPVRFPRNNSLFIFIYCRSRIEYAAERFQNPTGSCPRSALTTTLVSIHRLNLEHKYIYTVYKRSNI
jgi:hypothetical protein